MHVGIYLCAFLASVGLSLMLTRAVRNYAFAHGLALPPESPRHIHHKPVPRLGGVAVFASVVITLGLTILVETARETPTSLTLKSWVGIGVCATIIFVLGLCDDLFGLSPYVKLSVQIVAALGLYLSGLCVSKLVLFAGHPLAPTFRVLLTVFWVLLITNAFNLIDGLDGLLAGSALFSTIVIFSCSLVLGSAVSALVTVTLAGALVGFLRFNFNPASIFLGDSGSLFIGFVLSALALVQSSKSSTMVAVSIPIVCFGLPLLDVALAVIRRFLNGKPLFSADAEHIHHKLLKRGLSQRHAVLVLYGVSGLFSLTSLFMLYPSGKPLGLMFVMLGLGLLVGLQQLRYHEMNEMQRVLRRTLHQKEIISNNLRIRHAAEKMATIQTFGELALVLVETLEPIGFCGIKLRPAAEISLIDSEIAPMQKMAHGELQFIWDPAPNLQRYGEIKLPMIDSSETWLGSLSVLRSYSDERLLMDVNLFALLLWPAVADAFNHLARVHDDSHRATALKFRTFPLDPETMQNAVKH